jgi:lysophospholipase L1-like esterase
MSQDMSTAPEAASQPSGWRLFAIRLCILSVSALLFALLGELTIRWIAPQRIVGRWTENGRRGLRINKANWSARHDAAGHVVYYRFNEHHLRGGPIQGGKRRVLVLGDSFTFGWLLEERDTYLAKLARRCDQKFGPGEFEWLNGARGGWGTADYVAFAEEYGEVLKPDVVLVFLNFDDINRSTQSQLYRLDSQSGAAVAQTQPSSRLTAISDALPGYDWLLSNSHLVNLVRSDLNSLLILMRRGGVQSPLEKRDVSLTTSGEAAPADHSAAVRLGQALFLRLKDWCDERHCRLIVVTTGFHANPLLPADSCDMAFLAQAESFFAEAQVPFCDNSAALKERFAGRWSEFSIPGDGHANAAGAQLIAECAWPWLSEQLTAAQH